MYSLKNNNREVYIIFSEGNFIIRLSYRNWVGLAPDLVIEQVLMRSLKSNGRLTRGTQALKKLGEQYGFFLCSSVQLLI